MKTTIDISDDLAAQAKAYAAKERITLRSLVEPDFDTCRYIIR